MANPGDIVEFVERRRIICLADGIESDLVYYHPPDGSIITEPILITLTCGHAIAYEFGGVLLGCVAPNATLPNYTGVNLGTLGSVKAKGSISTQPPITPGPTVGKNI